MRFFYLLRLVAIAFFILGYVQVGFSQGCSGANGAGISGGAVSTNLGLLCANLDALGGPGTGAEITITAGNVALGDNVSFAINWDDGSPSPIMPAALASSTATSATWEIPNIVHYFPTTGANVKCEYIPRVTLIINGTPCTANFGSSPKFARWNVDNENSGRLDLTESVTAANVYLVCKGTEATVTFSDRSTLNCVPPEPNPINTGQRWRRFTYGTVNTITSATGVEVNGILRAYPFQGNVDTAPAPTQTPVPPTVTLPITVPDDAQVGEEFQITMEYWNTCNPFPGSTPVTQTAIIRIIDSPNQPTIPDRVICNNELGTAAGTLTITGPQAGVTYRWYATLADAQNNVNILRTGNNFAPNAAQAPVGVNDYFVKGIWGTNNCISAIEEVLLTRREDINAAPPLLVLPPTDVCPNTTYTYRLPSDPATEPTGGPTEFIWSVVPAANATILTGQGTKEITLQTTGTLGAFTLRVQRQYVNDPPACPSNFRNTVITVHANPTADIMPSPITMCEGETIVVDGNPSNPFGSIASHNWTGATGIIDDPSSQTPTILATATAAGSPYVLTYTVTNSIGCSSVPDNVTVTINANPTIAATGPDQALCNVFTSNGMGGSDPSPGTGTWSFVSSVPVRPAPAISNINDPNATITIVSGTEGEYTMRWTVTNGACTSSADIVVDLGSNPTDPVAGAAQTICGESATLAGNTPIIGTGTWTITGGPGGCVGGACPITITDPNDPGSAIQLNGPGFTYGAYTFRWRIVSGTCTPEDDFVTITFNRPPTASAPSDFTTCVDQIALAPITLTGGSVGGGATQGRWEIVSGAGTFTSNNANPGGSLSAANTDDEYRPVLADFNAGTIQLRLVALDPDGAGPTGPCGNVNSTTLTITIDKKPADANAGNDVAICDGTVATLGATAATNGGTGTWTGASGIFADDNDAGTDVTGLTAAGSPYTFTWTVTSALDGTAGACAPTANDMQVTVHTLPDALDPAPNDLCETTEGTNTADGVTLSDYNDGVTGITNSTDRTVIWYANASDQINNIPITTPFDVINGMTLYTRVIDTSNPEVCEQLGVVSFTVNPKPVALDQDFYLCEDFPIGTNSTEFDLTDAAYETDLTGGAADRTISWHTDVLGAESNTNLVASPAAYAVTGNATLFARVVNDITGCYNVAQVNLVVRPRPTDQPMLGSESPCLHGTELYRVGQVAGAHYTWDIPPDFTALGGGGLGGNQTDFYVLLEFGAVAEADIKLTMSLNGCDGNELTKHIKVSPDPAGFTIVPMASPICEGGIFPFSVSPNNTGSSTYNWQVLKKSNGAPGGGVVADGQTTGNVLINVLSEDIIIRVTESNASGCAGAPEELPVFINLRPIMNDTTVQICSGDVTGIILSENNVSPDIANAFEVHVPSILPGISPVAGPSTGIVGRNGIQNDSYRNQTIATALSLLYRVKPISPIGCYGEEKSVIVDIKAEPVMDINLGKSVCSDNPIEVTLKSAIGFLPADKFVIEPPILYDNTKLAPLTPLPLTGVLLDANAIYNNIWENTTSTDLQVVYNVRPYSTLTQCYGNPPAPVNVTIQRKPMVTPVADITICSGDVLNIPLTSTNVSNATFIWTVAQVNGNITGTTGSTTSTIADRLINNDLALGYVIYEVHATNPTSSPICSGPVQYIRVNVRPSPAITSPISQQVCSDNYGGNTYAQNLRLLEPSIGVATLNYTWFTDQNDYAGSQLTPDGSNNVIYTLTDEKPVFVRVLNTAATSGCYKDATVTFDIRPTPELTLDPDETTDPRFNITCNGLANGQVVVSAQYGTNHTFSLDGGGFVPTVLFSNVSAGTHTIRTKNSEGCVDQKSVDLIQPDPIVPGTPTVENVSCFNDPAPDGKIFITGTGGTSVAGGDALIFSLLQDPSITYDPATQSFSGLRATTYTVRVEDKNGCTKFVPGIVVSQPPDLALSIDITSDYNGYDVSCAGKTDGQISVLATNGGNPGYTFVLDQDPGNLSGQTDGTFDGLSSNILYTITVTDSKGCEKTSVPELLIDPIPLFAGVVGFDKNICEGADPTAFQVLASPFGGIGNYVYTWEESNDNTTWGPAAGINNDAVYDAPILADTMYYRRRVTSGTCDDQFTDVVKVTVHPLPTATLTAPSEVCEDDTFILTFGFDKGQEPYFFDYSDGTSTHSLVGGAQRPVPILNYTAATTYTLTHVRDFYGCEPAAYPASVTPQMISMNTDFTIAPSDPQCSGGVYTFNWTVNPNVEYVWSWNDGTPDEVIPATGAPAYAGSIPHTFTSANVSDTTVLPVTLTARSTILAACSKTSPAQSIKIFPAIFINLVSDKDAICSGETVKFINTTIGGTSHRWFYRTQGTNEVLGERPLTSPTTEDYILENNTTQNPIVYEMVYQVSNGSCSDEIVIPITVYRGMEADFELLAPTNQVYFIGGNALANFKNNSTPLEDTDFRFDWQYGVGAVPVGEDAMTPMQVRYTSIGPKNVRLIVTNEVAEAAGLTCFKEASMTVEVILPALNASFKYTPQTACFPVDIEITENLGTGDVFEWTLKDVQGNTLLQSNDSLPRFKVSRPGEYVVYFKTTNSITNQSATADNEATPIIIFDNPFAAFEVVPDTIVYVPDEKGIEMRNFSLRANTYFWDFDDGETSNEIQPQHHYQLEGKNVITLIASFNHGKVDQDGDGVLDDTELICYDTARQVILAKAGGRVKIPNAFTPDPSGPSGGIGDGMFNDVFRPVMEGVEEFHMLIYDRWGNLLFESKETSQGWDGYDKNGRLLPAGVYVYKITMRLSDSQRTTQVGDVTLIR